PVKGATSDDPGSRVPGAIVVDFKGGTTKAEFDAWEKEWRIELGFNSIEGAAAGGTIGVGGRDGGGGLGTLRGRPSVEGAGRLRKYQGTFIRNDPEFGKQWNLRQIHMPEAWELSRGKGVVVAVLDTGIAYADYQDFRQVPDLKGIKFVKGYNFVGDDEHPNDDHGHGTHVAGTIAQATNNNEGVAGIAFEAALIPLQVVDEACIGGPPAIPGAVRFAPQ